MTSRPASPDDARGSPNPGLEPAWPGLQDAIERQVLFLDALRRRGNVYTEHLAEGEPALLKFAHEVVLDGRDFERPCNYALLRVLPPEGVVPGDPRARPVVVVDPRAGHGPGIGGFKEDSEVGVALRAGHPVYFVTFRPEPEAGQTLSDVMDAEIRFLEEVVARHPQCPARPMVVGNCQAGWAMAMLSAVRPELVGTLMVVGAPLSYWAGSSTMNPMRYSGATLGGSWLASLTTDLAGERFDGAHLVENFEKLNPANTWWSKYHRLWADVDGETERFLAFERWWGGLFRMTGSEIETIVENLFVGNRLARGELTLGGRVVDLRHITAPVVVFASRGDNITPPPQALNWIIDTWGSERAIAAAGRTIVYVLHETVGHLGIFVGADIARKEHDQIVNSLDVVEHLPPGLYEMKLSRKDGADVQRWDALEPGSYSVNFEHRTMADLQALNPEGREEEALFAKVAQLSEMQATAYKTWVRPWLRSLPLKPLGDAMMHSHPLRLQRSLFSDASPLVAAIGPLAEHVRAHRHALSADHPARAWENSLTTLVETALNNWRDLRDRSVVNWTRLAFGPFGWGAWLPDRPSDEETRIAQAQTELEQARREMLPRVADGGFPQAVCRIILAGMKSVGVFERRSFRLAALLSAIDASHRLDNDPAQWRALMRDEARIAAVAPVEALNALLEMLPDTDSRERALAVAAAVMMIEPTLANPRSEIIELLIGMFGVDPARVMDLACRTTASLGGGDPPPTAAPARPRAPRRAPPRATRTPVAAALS